MLAVNIAKVSDEEGIFITRFTHLMVDGFHAPVESLANQLLGVNQSILLERILKYWILQYDIRMIDIVVVGVEDSRCNNHIPGVTGVRLGNRLRGDWQVESGTGEWNSRRVRTK